MDEEGLHCGKRFNILLINDFLQFAPSLDLLLCTAGEADVESTQPDGVFDADGNYCSGLDQGNIIGFKGENPRSPV